MILILAFVSVEVFTSRLKITLIFEFLETFSALRVGVKEAIFNGAIGVAFTSLLYALSDLALSIAVTLK